MTRRAIYTLLAIVVLWAFLRFAVPGDVVRAANVALSMLAAFGVAMRVNDMWQHLTYGRRLIFGTVAAMFLVAAYGSAEAYVAGVGAGERVHLWATSCLVVLFGLWVSRHDPRTYP